jgi:hypothetical protein
MSVDSRPKNSRALRLRTSRLFDYKLPTHGQTIHELVARDLGGALMKSKELKTVKYPSSVFMEVLELIISRSYFRKNRARRFKRRLEQLGLDLSQISPGKLTESRWKSVLGEFNTAHSNIIRKVDSFLVQLGDRWLREWLQDRYTMRAKRDRSLKEITFGEKGIDILLRDCGYLDRVPIDIHEQRFLVRTGIFERYSERGDPLRKADFHYALTAFCKSELAGMEFEGISLEDAPGVVDWAIWYFCAREWGDICGEKPRCSACPLAEGCEFGSSH